MTPTTTPATATETIEFDDCEVASIAADGNGLCIRFSAATIVRRDATPGARPETGFARGVELLLKGVDAADVPADGVGRLARGRLELDGVWRSQLPLPFSVDRPVRLDFSFANRTSLALKASGLECRYAGTANFSESLFC